MKITVIPAIDVIGGKCVRLTRGNYDECKTYYDDPVEAARRFEDMGMKAGAGTNLCGDSFGGRF